MSEEEVNELRSKICYGLALSDWKMLKEKSSRNEKIVTRHEGKVAILSAKYLYRELYGDSKEFIPIESNLHFIPK